ncbi:MAG: metallopeptidase family protein [Anaerolineae bacterium]
MRYSEAAFESIVARALDNLPDWIRERMDNVAVLTQPWPTRAQLEHSHIDRNQLLLGLYEGIPLTKRGRGYQLTPPDRITLFQGPLEIVTPDESSLERAVRRTVIHEVAHHFGISDERLEELDM